ncbi:MAG: hypothetical protein AAB250_12365 [Bdellovibrionota bacterium]
MRLSRRLLQIFPVIGLLAPFSGEARPAPKPTRVLELEVTATGTWYVLEEATSGKTPIRSLSIRRNQKTTHSMTIPIEVSDRLFADLKKEVVGEKPPKCPRPRRMIERWGRDTKTTEFCAESYSADRRKRLQNVVDEMQSRLEVSMGGK